MSDAKHHEELIAFLDANIVLKGKRVADLHGDRVLRQADRTLGLQEKEPG